MTDTELEFLFNDFNPRAADAREVFEAFRGDAYDITWLQYCAWLADKVIGEPQESETVTVAQMKGEGLVGIYKRKPEP